MQVSDTHGLKEGKAVAASRANGSPEPITLYHWLVVLLASCGWLFDCMGQRIFVLSREPALRELLGATVSDADVKYWGGWATAGLGAVILIVFVVLLAFAAFTTVIVLLIANRASLGNFAGILNSRLGLITSIAEIVAPIGGAAMVVGYFLYESVALQLGYVTASVEVPINVGQVLVGLIVSIPVVRSIQKVTGGHRISGGTAAPRQ